MRITQDLYTIVNPDTSQLNDNVAALNVQSGGVLKTFPSGTSILLEGKKLAKNSSPGSSSNLAFYKGKKLLASYKFEDLQAVFPVYRD